MPKMWPFSKAVPDKVRCFFCSIEVDSKDAFVIQYKALDGIGNVKACPMCAGMLNDMKMNIGALYETD